MGCACVYVDAEDSQPSFHIEKIRRAAKEHRCGECGDSIARRQNYEETRGCWEGEWSRYRTCLPCVEVRRALFCDGWTYGDCWSRIDEHFVTGATLAGCLEEVPSVAGREKLAAAFRVTIDRRLDRKRARTEWEGRK